MEQRDFIGKVELAFSKFGEELDNLNVDRRIDKHLQELKERIIFLIECQ